jgi:hypothetical protein
MFERVLHNGGNPFVPQETLTIASVFVLCDLLAEPLVLDAVTGVVIFVDVQLQFDLLYHLLGKRVVKAESDALESLVLTMGDAVEASVPIFYFWCYGQGARVPLGY